MSIRTLTPRFSIAWFHESVIRSALEDSHANPDYRGTREKQVHVWYVSRSGEANPTRNCAQCTRVKLCIVPALGGPAVSTQVNVSGRIGLDWAKLNFEKRTSHCRGPVSSPAAAVNFDGACPTLRTRRFRFRPFETTDIGRMAVLAGEHRIADTSIGIPHPYTLEFARMWVSSRPDASNGRDARGAALGGARSG